MYLVCALLMRLNLSLALNGGPVFPVLGKKSVVLSGMLPFSIIAVCSPYTIITFNKVANRLENNTALLIYAHVSNHFCN